MEYADFIRDLRPLKEEAAALFNLEQTHHEPAFRRWRHRVTALISAIEDRGYSIDCGIASRLFDIPTYGPVTRAERIDRYNRELHDTINELETIIDHFDKYGDPKGQKTQQAVFPTERELEWPQKITLLWLFKHAPIDVWLKFAGVLAAAFLIGIGFAQTGLYAAIQDLWKPKVPGSSATKEPDPSVETDARKSGRGSAGSLGQLSSTCRFTQGPRAGQVQSYKGTVQPIPVGSPCTDGQQSFGAAIPD